MSVGFAEAPSIRATVWSSFVTMPRYAIRIGCEKKFSISLLSMELVGVMGIGKRGKKMKRY